MEKRVFQQKLDIERYEDGTVRIEAGCYTAQARQVVAHGREEFERAMGELVFGPAPILVPEGTRVFDDTHDPDWARVPTLKDE